MSARSAYAWLISVMIFIAPPVALSAKWPTAYWNVSFNGQPLSCMPIERKKRDLRAFFEARNRESCVLSDEVDHLLFACGKKIKEVVVFSREECGGWLKEPLTSERSRNLAAFNGCFAKAKERIGHDKAIPYCSCTTSAFQWYSEQELGKLPRSQIEAITKTCISDVSDESSHR